MLKRQLRLLFLLPFPPRHDALHGGARAIAQLVSGLARKHPTAVLYLRAADEPPIEPALQHDCVIVEEVLRPQRIRAHRWHRLPEPRLLAGLIRGRPLWSMDWEVTEYSARLQTLVDRWRPDIVQIEYTIMAQYAAALDRWPAAKILTVYELSAWAARETWQAKWGKGQCISYLDLRAWERFEHASIKRVDAAVVLTKHDQHILTPRAGTTPVVPIPLATIIPPQPLDPLGQPPWRLVFVGNFKHPPNVDAALRLIKHILPLVRSAWPDVRVYIVGDNPPPQLQALHSNEVIVTGRVADVTPYLDQAALVVVPLRLGGGMRVKVLEALAAGKAVVASQRAVAGLTVTDGEHVVLADTDHQFGAAISALLDDAERRRALGARARQWACSNLDGTQRINAYEALYTAMIK